MSGNALCFRRFHWYNRPNSPWHMLPPSYHFTKTKQNKKNKTNKQKTWDQAVLQCTSVKNAQHYFLLKRVWGFPIIQYILSCNLFFSNVNISWLSFHINPYKSTSSFLKLLYSMIYHSLFNSSIDVYFGCFQPFIIDKATKNIINTIPYTFLCFSWFSLAVWSVHFYFSRYCQIALQNIWTNLYSSTAWECLVLHTIPSVNNVNSFFNMMGEKRYLLVYYFGCPLLLVKLSNFLYSPFQFPFYELSICVFLCFSFWLNGLFLIDL